MVSGKEVKIETYSSIDDMPVSRKVSVYKETFDASLETVPVNCFFSVASFVSYVIPKFDKVPKKNVYANVNAYLKRCGRVQKVPGKRGVYQRIR